MKNLRKNSFKMKLVAATIAMLMIISVASSFLNVVLALGTASIQLNGMNEVRDGFAGYGTPMDQETEAGRIIGLTEGAQDVGDPVFSGNQNTYTYPNLNAGTYTFKVIVNDGCTLNNVMIKINDGQDIPAQVTPIANTTNEYTFTVTLVDGDRAIINPSFGGGNPNPQPFYPDNPGPGPGPVPGPQDLVQIWVGDTKVIDETVEPPIVSAQSDESNPTWKIHAGNFHSSYELEFLTGGVTIPAITIEGNAVLSLNMASKVRPESNQTILPDVILANDEGYSISSNDPLSNVSVETQEAGGPGSLQINGSINIRGYLGFLDNDVTIGTRTNRITQPITANNIMVQYSTVNIYGSSALFMGLSDQSKMNMDILSEGNLIADTTGTQEALVNFGTLMVKTGGKADIKTIGTLGEYNTQVKYYDFVNFETTQAVEQGEDQVTINDLTDGTHEKYKLTTTTDKRVQLESLSKPLYTLSFNMTDENGDIIEDTRVTHGTVKIITACGIGRGADGRGCNDFKIEAGTPVTAVLLPDYGYQFTLGSINGAAITTAQADVATYTFIMPAGHIHFSALFTKTDDTIVVNNDEVVGASVSNLEGKIKGNAEFKVEEAQNVDDAKFNAASNDYSIAGFANLSLNEVILKGNETDSWKTNVTDLDDEMTVSLTVSDDVAAELESSPNCGVLREHNGEVKLIDATYDKETKKLSFNTDVFSTYAIAYKTTDTTLKDSTPKTGTIKYVAMTIGTIFIASIIVSITMSKKVKVRVRKH